MEEIHEWVQIARENIERHAGDVIDVDSMTEEEIQEEYRTLAYGGLKDAGCPPHLMESAIQKALAAL